jgi:hypothetical protein
MPADADKVYLKKNKINDLLNDLYTAIAQNKPDNPLEFCIKHFESKLPTPPPPKSSLVDQSSNNAASNNLLNKLFDRAIGGGAGIEASKSLAGSNSPHNVSQQLSNLNIVVNHFI